MKGISLQGKDSVAAMDVVPFDSEDSRLLIASRKGFGKLSLLRHYRQQKRGGKGLITLKLTPKNGKVAAAEVVQSELEGDHPRPGAVFGTEGAGSSPLGTW